MALGRRCPTGSRTRSTSTSRGSRSATGKRFGDPSDPLLVSVRSGAAVSMPGMMDTILNLGLNDAAVEGLARTHRQPRASRYDSYRRLIQMYGEVVDGIDGHRFEQALADLKPKRGAAQDTDLDRRRPRGADRDVQGDLPREHGRRVPAGRARAAARARCAPSSTRGRTPRAQVYRRAHDIPDDLGTAVNVVQMVFGNKGERLRHRRRFTRDPSTGEQGLYGEFLANAQGEDVVAGHPHAASRSRRCRRACPRRTSSCSRRCAGSRSTTATCRTSSSRSRTSGSTCCRRARRSAPPRRR